MPGIARSSSNWSPVVVVDVFAVPQIVPVVCVRNFPAVSQSTCAPTAMAAEHVAITRPERCTPPTPPSAIASFVTP